MFENSNNLLEDLQETVAPAADGDGAYIGVIVLVIYLLALKPN